MGGRTDRGVGAGVAARQRADGRDAVKSHSLTTPGHSGGGIERVFSPFFTTRPRDRGLPVDRPQDRRRARRRIDCSHARRGHGDPGDLAVTREDETSARRAEYYVRSRSASTHDQRNTRMGRILVADDHDSLRRGSRRHLPKRATTSRGAERQRCDREAARRDLRRHRQRPEDGGSTGIAC